MPDVERLLEGHVAGARTSVHHRNGEIDRTVLVGRATGDRTVRFGEQQDRIALGAIDAKREQAGFRTLRGELQAIFDRPRSVGAEVDRPEQRREARRVGAYAGGIIVAALVLTDRAFVHDQCRHVRIFRVLAARTIVLDGEHVVGQVKADRLAVAVRVRDRLLQGDRAGFSAQE